MLLRDFLKEGISRLEPLYPTPEARDIILSLCESRLGIGRYTYATDPQYSIGQESLAVLSEDLDRLAAAEPLQYVLGFSDFHGHRFKVTPDVLIPRPETEILCDEAIKIARGHGSAPKVLDLCTGSGCIAWTMALELPGALVYGIDVSEKALAVASGQGILQSHSGVEATVPERSRRVVFLQADILQDPLSFPCGQFDLILSNPPYVLDSQKKEMRPNVLEYEPPIALFVPDENPLVFYRAVARWSQALLAPAGTGIVEINNLLGERTRDLFLSSGFKDVSIIKDFSVKSRFVKFSK
ncbi:MAG: peptide chain release factor N(5)-glutamine methyltransferase [Bacteroidales bacterium]|nr:peptide chain release factor N(5)-glutamine methyltransferase [Bacteroidales bacterium]